MECGVNVSGIVVLGSSIPLSGASLLMTFGCLTALLRCKRNRWYEEHDEGVLAPETYLDAGRLERRVFT